MQRKLTVSANGRSTDADFVSILDRLSDLRCDLASASDMLEKILGNAVCGLVLGLFVIRRKPQPHDRPISNPPVLPDKCCQPTQDIHHSRNRIRSRICTLNCAYPISLTLLITKRPHQLCKLMSIHKHFVSTHPTFSQNKCQSTISQTMILTFEKPATTQSIPGLPQHLSEQLKEGLAGNFMRKYGWKAFFIMKGTVHFFI
jgi:hypothetical protein